MRHLKARDYVQFMFTALIFAALMFFTGFLEKAPTNVALVIALVMGLILWLIWFALLIRDRVVVASFRDRDVYPGHLYIFKDGRWVRIESDGTMPNDGVNNDPIRIFDQDEEVK